MGTGVSPGVGCEWSTGTWPSCGLRPLDMGQPRHCPWGAHNGGIPQTSTDRGAPGNRPPCFASRVPGGPSRLGGWVIWGVGWAQPVSRPRCRRSCGDGGTASAWARCCRTDTTPAATRPRPSAPAAPPARSCCSPRAAAAMGPAWTPRRRPAWPATSLGWPSAPAEAPRSPRWGCTQGPREVTAGQCRTDPPRTPEVWERVSGPTIFVSPREVVRGAGRGMGHGGCCAVNACPCPCDCLRVSAVGGNACPPRIKSWHCGREPTLGTAAGAGRGQL